MTTETAAPMQSRRRWVLIATGVLGLAIGATAAWFRVHPAAFQPSGDEVSNDRVQVGHPMYFGVAWVGPNATGSVTIHDVQPHDLTDSTAAEIAFYVCSFPSGAGIGSAAEGRIDESCTDLIPAAGAELEPGRGQLVVAVTPERPGELKFRGVDLDYSLGWRRGTRVVGPTIGVKTAARGRGNAEHGPYGNVDPPTASTPRQALAMYLNAAQHHDCAVAEMYADPNLRTNGDLCADGAPGGLRFDAWRLDPETPKQQVSATAHIYGVDLHITQHGCAGSICSNGWHTTFVEVHETGGIGGYLVDSIGTGP